MGPGRFTTFPPRVWTVDIVTTGGRPTATCRLCGQLEHAASPHGMLRGTVLQHLARHARSDLTPAHLRTCQCGRRGCSWHRRHRGCRGPIALALTRSADSRTWQLADTCHQCRTTMPATATVPEPPPSEEPAIPHDVPDSARPTHEDEDQVWQNTGTSWW